MRRRTQSKRIVCELADEIKRIAEKNDKSFVEASEEVARLLKLKKNNKLKYEIQF